MKTATPTQKEVAADLLERQLSPKLTAENLAAFKHAFYTNTGDETDDPFGRAFVAIGYVIIDIVKQQGPVGAAGRPMSRQTLRLKNNRRHRKT